MLRRPADTSTAEITLTKRWWRAVVRAVRRGEAWPGTRYERAALQRAITRYCSCGVGRMGVRVFDCPSHRLLGQPEVLKRLVFARRIAERLRAHEFGAPEPAGTDHTARRQWLG